MAPHLWFPTLDGRIVTVGVPSFDRFVFARVAVTNEWHIAPRFLVTVAEALSGLCPSNGPRLLQHAESLATAGGPGSVQLGWELEYVRRGGVAQQLPSTDELEARQLGVLWKRDDWRQSMRPDRPWISPFALLVDPDRGVRPDSRRDRSPSLDRVVDY